MDTITVPHFADFYNALYGYEPFPWQMRLVEQVCTGAWSQVIALPTASGKTAVIDIAVFALAYQAARPEQMRTAARRIFYVVDRRVIVDEAYERSYRLAQSLANAEGGIVRAVADQLRALAGGDAPLACYQLRGGIYRDDNWARTPIQPTVIASTVDQIGSRLLFRGYGLRSGSKYPIHAGLTAYDSLIILDEAHCAVPFGETMDAVSRYRQWAEIQLALPFTFVSMTATPPVHVGSHNVTRASVDDLQHPVLGPRLSANKPTALMIAKKAKGADAQMMLAEEITQHAINLGQKNELKAIGIIVNRVATAKLVRQLLEKRAVGDVVLLIGRMRSLDRDRTVNDWLRRLNANTSDSRLLERPVYVVATQCLEVGANLDFDGLVSECASLDALRQRFGRLNRMGRNIAAAGVIVIRADQIKPREPDPIYGSSLSETWAWLSEQIASQPTLDMGVNALNGALDTARQADPSLVARLEMAAPYAPVMLPAHIDCWAQTAPTPTPSPDESIFLHGPERGVPDVQVVWRADLDATSVDADAWIQTLSLCPPTSSEYMLVPIHHFRKWLAGEEQATPDLSDVNNLMQEQTATNDLETAQPRTVLRWNGPEYSELINEPYQVRPGDTLVLPASLAGWDTFGHIPDPEKGVDLGDQAYRNARGQSILRIHPELLRHYPACAAKQHLVDMDKSELPENTVELREYLSELADAAHDTPWLANAARDLAKDRRLKVHMHPFGGWVLLASRRRQGAGDAASFTDEDATSSSTVAVELLDHCAEVSKAAHAYARICGLPDTLSADVALAARLHDLGKADPRFQKWLVGGNPWNASASMLLAKSARLPANASEIARTREKSGYPQGGRHELLSARLAENTAELLREASDPDLVLHLIASHHGHCRPFAPVVLDDAPLEVAIEVSGTRAQANSRTGMEQLNSGTAERFWRLTRRYGWWGLAYLESLVRLADHHVSAMEQQRKDKEVSQ